MSSDLRPDMDDMRPTLRGGGEPLRPSGIGDSDGAGFFQSAIESATQEFIGRDASRDVEQYRAENPVRGVLSQVAGQVPYFAAPYAPVTGPVIQGALRSTPVIGRGLQTAEQVRRTRPGLGEAMREVAIFTPMETGRTALTAATGGDAGQVFNEALWNVGIGAVAGGAIGSMQRSIPPREEEVGRIAQYQKHFDPDIDLNAPPQVLRSNLRNIRQREDLSEEWAHQIDDDIRILGQKIRREDIPNRSLPGFQGFDRERRGRAASRLWERRLQPRDSRDISVKKLMAGRGNKILDTTEEIEDYARRAGFPDDWESHVQFPRLIQAKNRRTAQEFQKQVEDMFGDPSHIDDMGRPTWVQREADDQGYWMTRKVTGSRQPDQHDEFITFRTDDPRAFGDRFRHFGNAQARQVFALNLYDPQRRTREKIPFAETADKLGVSISPTAKLQGKLREAKGSRQKVEKVVEEMLSEEQLGKIRHAADAAGRTFNPVKKIAEKYLLGSMNRYSGSPRAARMSQMAKMLHDAARGQANRILTGTVTRGSGEETLDMLGMTAQSQLKQIFSPQLSREGIFQQVERLRDVDIEHVQIAKLRSLSPEEAAEQGATEQAVEFLKSLREIDNYQIPGVQAAAELQGHSFTPKDNHYLLSNIWQGRLRGLMKDADGRVRAIASGDTDKTLRENRQALYEHYRDNVGIELPGWEVRQAGDWSDLDAALTMWDRDVVHNLDAFTARAPGRFNPRSGMGGFEGHIEPLTRKQLREQIGRNVRDSHRYMSEALLRHDMQDELKHLVMENPHYADVLQDELKQLFGRGRGPWEPLEDMWNKRISPLVGVDAQRLSEVTNAAVFHLTLGFGNVGFAALNALTPIQTAMPEAAWVLTAPPRHLQEYYAPALVAQHGRVREMRTLDPLKLMMKGMNDLRNPSRELQDIMARAREEGIVSPQLAENVFGADSNLVRHFRSFAEGKRDIIEFTNELSGYMPAKTEEMARVMAMNMGVRIGKDFFRLSDEPLYQFARQFVNNSQFRYDAGDRPRMITGAFGSLAGLFKNWMLHYIGNTMRFAGEGFMRGNWKPLLWQQAGALSVAGTSGSMAYPVADGFSRWLSEDDESLFENLYNMFGYSDQVDAFLGEDGRLGMADSIYFGLPAFLNVGLSHRAAVPGADIPNDIEQLFTVAAWDRAVAFGDLMMDSVEAYNATGKHPATSRQVMDSFARFAMPRTIQAGFVQTEENALRSLNTGNTIMSDMTFQDRTLHALGFQPRELARTYEASSQLFKEQDRKRQLIAQYGEALRQAREENDSRAIHNIYMRAREDGVTDFSAIMRSADSRESKANEDMLERMFDDYRVQGLRRMTGLD